MDKRKFDIEVRRNEISTITVSVEASTDKEAHHLAIDAAADHDFRSEGNVISVDYETDMTADQSEADGAIETVEAKYLADGGNHCPACGSSEMECSILETDGLAAWRTVECDKCPATWQENFVLTGITEADGFTPEAPV